MIFVYALLGKWNNKLGGLLSVFAGHVRFGMLSFNGKQKDSSEQALEGVSKWWSYSNEFV